MIFQDGILSYPPSSNSVLGIFILFFCLFTIELPKQHTISIRFSRKVTIKGEPLTTNNGLRSY